MTAPLEEQDKADVQRLVVKGYKLQCCRHFVLTVTDPAGARAFLAALVNMRLVAHASLDNKGLESRQRRGRFPVHAGFTFRGLGKLELPLPYLQVFREKARAFAEGAYLRAARRLADTGASAPQSWDGCFRPDRADVLLSIYAGGQDQLTQFTRALRETPGACGLGGWDAALDGCHLNDDETKRIVHFGFRDGISNPTIKDFLRSESEGVPKQPKPHAAGEFLLGYDNDDGFNPWLLINPGDTPNPWLRPLADIDPQFFRNGSFAAFRKIEQHEDRFAEFIDAAAWRLSRSQAEFDEKRLYVRAKLLGRWDDGQVVKPDTPDTPQGKDPRFEEAKINDFDFLDDANGEGCPFGAHIRRMNPRADPVVPFRRRPLARRGIPYGPRYDPKCDESVKAKRGLLGLFFCASLEDQFEHVLAEWANANPMGTGNRGNAKDPLIGNHEDPGTVFDIPVRHDGVLPPLDQFKPFVTTRGTLYAFYPGLKALARIAGIEPATHIED